MEYSYYRRMDLLLKEGLVPFLCYLFRDLDLGYLRR